MLDYRKSVGARVGGWLDGTLFSVPLSARKSFFGYFGRPVSFTECGSMIAVISLQLRLDDESSSAAVVACPFYGRFCSMSKKQKRG